MTWGRPHAETNFDAMNRFLAFLASTILLWLAAVELKLAVFLLLALSLSAFDPAIARVTLEGIPELGLQTVGTIVGACGGGFVAALISPAFDRTRWLASAWTISLVTIGLTFVPFARSEFVAPVALGLPGGLGVAAGALTNLVFRRRPAMQPNALWPPHIRRTAAIVVVFWCVLWGSSYGMNRATADEFAGPPSPPASGEPATPPSDEPARLRALSEVLRATIVSQSETMAQVAGALAVGGGLLGAILLGVVFGLSNRQRAPDAEQV
jgi:hypothetical protein